MAILFGRHFTTILFAFAGPAPELKMRKRVQCDPGFHLSAMSVFAVMFILIFPRHVRRSIRFDFLFIRSSAVRRFYLRRFVRVIVCVGGLGFEIRV